MLNVKNLQRFRDYLDTLHDAALEQVECEFDDSSFNTCTIIEQNGFNMHNWEDDCGTPCCIGGHLLHFFNFSYISVYEAAKRKFNLNLNEARNLFVVSEYQTKKLSDALSAIDFLIENPNENSYDERIWNTKKTKNEALL